MLRGSRFCDCRQQPAAQHMQQISKKLLQSVYRQAFGILNLDKAKETATVANALLLQASAHKTATAAGREGSSS